MAYASKHYPPVFSFLELMLSVALRPQKPIGLLAPELCFLGLIFWGGGGGGGGWSVAVRPQKP